MVQVHESDSPASGFRGYIVEHKTVLAFKRASTNRNKMDKIVFAACEGSAIHRTPSLAICIPHPPSIWPTIEPGFKRLN
jgi:hypothetical protein